MSVISNPDYEACRNYLVVGYQYHGDAIFAYVDKTAKATKEEIEASWQKFEEHRLAYNQYKSINVGPAPLYFKQNETPNRAS